MVWFDRMKILFLTHAYPNYVPDLLLHGLRKLIGADVVDYPRKDCLYQGVLGLGVCPANQLCPGWFPDDNGEIDRLDIPAKVARGYFTHVVSDVRALNHWRDQLYSAPRPPVLIDGEDRPFPVRPGNHILCRRETDGSDYSIPLPMALPEEIFRWITSYDEAPKRYSIGFLGSTPDGRRRELIAALAGRYPNCLFSASTVPSADNPFPEGRFGRDEYYRELQKCRMVLSLPGSGFDTFRFWENAACNALHLAQRFPLYLPDDFESGTSILRFADIDQLHRVIEQADSNGDACREMIMNSRLRLFQSHLTTSRARYFLDRIRCALGG
jgi:hypothetical protein